MEDYYKRSYWLYVKLQSLYEYLGKTYSNYMPSFVLPVGGGAARIIEAISSAERIPDDSFKKSFYQLNSFANRIKHENDIIDFKHSQVRQHIETYNWFVNQLAKSSTDISREFLISLDQLSENITASVGPTETKRKPFTSRHFDELFRKKMKEQQTEQPVDKKTMNNLKLESHKDQRALAGVQLIKNKESQLRRVKPVAPKKATHKIQKVQDAGNMRDVYIPCGTSHQDQGFLICGLVRNNECLNANSAIYATIYNFLQRSLNMCPSSYLRSREQELRTEINYKNVYRYKMLLLCMIRDNYFTDSISIKVVDGKETEVKLAYEDIVSYAGTLAKLSGHQFEEFHLEISPEGKHEVSLHEHGHGVYTMDVKKRQTDSRDIWFESNIIYEIKDHHREDLMVLLQDFFALSDFKPGQFEALRDSLNAHQHSVCIMPTGAGKSLIYYFITLLNPNPSLIVSPTSVLIGDQIRNLAEIHNIDDAFHVSEADFSKNFSVKNKFVYLTPLAFQNYQLIFSIIDLNVSKKIGSVILDEVHTISNWSHDFRPDYLMLSFNLLTFVDKGRLFCFTATANYKVLSDVLNQLRINPTFVFSPIEMRRSDMFFSFQSLCTPDEVVDTVSMALQDNIQKGTRTLLFIKAWEEYETVKEKLPKRFLPHIDRFSVESTESYRDFVEGKTSVLVSDKDMGIGINLPAIQETIHIGLPVSKSQYVQEIGRAGRLVNGAKSSVIYKSRENRNEVEHKLISFNTTIDEIISLLTDQPDSNYLASAFRQILGHVESPEQSAVNIRAIYNKLKDVENYTRLSFSFDNKGGFAQNALRTQRYLYVLFRLGIIYNWYIAQYSKEEGILDFFVEMEFTSKELEFVKKSVKDYLRDMNANEDVIFNIKEADSVESIIYLYQQWYYHEFLYHHREQLLNMLSFLDYYTGKESDMILADLSNYFSVSLTNIETDYEQFAKLNYAQIVDIIALGIGAGVFSNLQSSVERNYNSRLDFAIMCYEVYQMNTLSQSRFQRVLNRTAVSVYQDMLDNLSTLYAYCSNKDKALMVLTLAEKESLPKAIETIFGKAKKDLVFFGFLSYIANKTF